MERKEFNKKWYPVIKEVLEKMDKEKILDIKKEPVLCIKKVVALTARKGIKIPDMVGFGLKADLYIIDGKQVLATEKDLKYALNNVVEKFLHDIRKETEISEEYKILVDLLIKTALVAIEPEEGPIFQVETKNKICNVYTRTMTINILKNNEVINTIVKSLTNDDLAKQLLGELRRQIEVKNKWVPMSYGLYDEYNCKGYIKEVDLEKRLELLEEKSEFVKHNKMDVKRFIKLFTIIPEEDINKIPRCELMVVKNTLLNLALIWKGKKSGKNVTLYRHIPDYFKVNVKFN